ncbi:hypothetical protein BT96DRAFT_374588 [Gymnopus androsaceus JB14]|uniref:Ubiquitin-like-conjugating enzyme ATG10 n=1 Tax=Gymnopus androsaceus JB14 TaxID=1447944 RepID=A0A6A4IDT3_9AGAR|nr:hypothetical protein BT96DRAFT_374588 [Gymnopus androsaceus JB14]
MLTRPQFDRACKLLIEEYANCSSSLSTNAMQGWCWNEHPSFSGLGYMSRTSDYLGQASSDNLDPEDDCIEIDEATASISIVVSTSQQYVMFSATFQVPCFYFTMYHPNGAPLSIDELLSTSLFRPCILEDAETTSFALTRPNAAFPLLSQGDHPTTGRPCWFLHPCETTAAVEELMKEIANDGDSEDTRLLKWLKMWFTVLGSAVDLA